MDDLANIVSDQAAALLDTDSLTVNFEWDPTRFPMNARAACLVIQAMNYLQSTKDGAINMPVMDECMNFHLSYLPDEASKILNFQRAYSLNNPSHLFDINLTGKQFREANDKFRNENPEFFENVRNARWTIMPLGFNEHFTTVILYTKNRKMTGTPRGFRTIIKNAIVADPEKNKQLEALMWNRLRLILSEKRGFTFKHSQPVKLWFPKQDDFNSCGLRVYEIMRVMLMRISQSAAEEGLIDGYNPAYIWRDLSGDFQPDKVRAEMIGILANVAMRYTHWSTRICLVPVSHVKDRTMGGVDNWIPTDSCGARLSALPNRRAMQYSENVLVDRLLRLGIAPTPDMMQLSPDFSPAKNPGFTFIDQAEWGTLPPRDPLASPPSPPLPPGKPVTPAGLGLTTPAPVTGTEPESSLPPALRPNSKSAPTTPAGPTLVTPSKVPLPKSGTSTPLKTPLPPSRITTPAGTPRRPGESPPKVPLPKTSGPNTPVETTEGSSPESPDRDVPMSDTEEEGPGPWSPGLDSPMSGT